MGYWEMGEGGGSFVAGDDPENQMMWGDEPADIVGEALQKIKVAFLRDLGRMPSRKEIINGLKFTTAALEGLAEEPKDAPVANAKQAEVISLLGYKAYGDHVSRPEDELEAWKTVRGVLQGLDIHTPKPGADGKVRYCGEEPHWDDNPPQVGPPDAHLWSQDGETHFWCPRTSWQEIRRLKGMTDENGEPIGPEELDPEVYDLSGLDDEPCCKKNEDSGMAPARKVSDYHDITPSTRVVDTIEWLEERGYVGVAVPPYEGADGRISGAVVFRPKDAPNLPPLMATVGDVLYTDDDYSVCVDPAGRETKAKTSVCTCLAPHMEHCAAHD